MPFGASRGQGFNNPALNRLVVSGTGSGDGVFVYAGTPGLGNPPIGWITNGSLTDPYGNVLPAIMGLMRTGAGTSAEFALTTGRPAEFQSGQVYSYVQNLGLANEQYYVEILGPENTNQKDAAYAAFQSSASDKSSSAAGFLTYIDTGGGFNTNVQWDYTGTQLNVVRLLTAVKPGSGTTPANPAVPETWHAVTGDTGWSAVSGYSGIQYRLKGDGNVQFTGAAQHASITATLAINSSNPLAAAYRPATIKILSSGNSPLSRLMIEYRTDGILYALANAASPGTIAEIDKAVPLSP